MPQDGFVRPIRLSNSDPSVVLTRLQNHWVQQAPATNKTLVIWFKTSQINGYERYDLSNSPPLVLEPDPRRRIGTMTINVRNPCTA